MSHVTFQVRLDDEEGLLKAHDFLSSYINAQRLGAARARHETKPTDVGDTIERIKAEADATLPSPPEEEKEEPDSAGQKWDAELHSASRTKLKDGTWRLRKGTKTADRKPVPPPPGDDAGLAPEEMSYKNMMDVLKGKGLDLPAMNALAQRIGVDSIGLITARPELIPAILTLADRK